MSALARLRAHLGQSAHLRHLRPLVYLPLALVLMTATSNGTAAQALVAGTAISLAAAAHGWASVRLGKITATALVAVGAAALSGASALTATCLSGGCDLAAPRTQALQAALLVLMGSTLLWLLSRAARITAACAVRIAKTLKRGTTR